MHHQCVRRIESRQRAEAKARSETLRRKGGSAASSSGNPEVQQEESPEVFAQFIVDYFTTNYDEDMANLDRRERQEAERLRREEEARAATKRAQRARRDEQYYPKRAKSCKSPHPTTQQSQASEVSPDTQAPRQDPSAAPPSRPSAPLLSDDEPPSDVEGQDQDQDEAPPIEQIIAEISQGNFENAHKWQFCKLNHPDFDKFYATVNHAMFEELTKFEFCPKCRECAPHTVLVGDKSQCKVCRDTKKQSDQQILQATGEEGKGVSKFAVENDQNPREPPMEWTEEVRNAAKQAFALLPKLTRFEEHYISIVHPSIRVYRLPGGGTGYSGNVINLSNDVLECMAVLPPRTEELPDVVMIRRDSARPNGRTYIQENRYTEFKVNRHKIEQWLKFLIRYNPLYRSIVYSEENLELLPVNGDVVNRLPQVYCEDLNPDDDEEDDDDDDSSEAEDDPMRNGPEQGRATGPVDAQERSSTFQSEFVGLPVDTPRESGKTREEEMEEQLMMHIAHARNQYRAERLGPGYGTSRNPVRQAPLGKLVNDFNTPNIQAMAFPTLFPFGTGDTTKQARTTLVTMNEGNRHLMWFAVKDPETGKIIYPFVVHDSWCFWAQNTDERHRFQKQQNFYWNNAGDHRNYSLEDLVKILEDRHNPEHAEQLRDILSKMSRYAANILGSPAYFRKKRQELEAVMGQLGCCTAWFTLSAADNHWKDMHDAFPMDMPEPEQEEEESTSNAQESQDEDEMEDVPDLDEVWKEDENSKAKKRRLFVKENPHIVDWYFCARSDKMLMAFFLHLCITWWWYRIEYQKRGTPHFHGCFRLKSDPNLTLLANSVAACRRLQVLLMHFLPDCLDPEGADKDTLWPYDQFKGHADKNDDTSDVFVKESYEQRNLPDEIKEAMAANGEERQRLVNEIKKTIRNGMENEQIIIQLNDFLITSSCHPADGKAMPVDAESDTRDESTKFTPSATKAHPSTKDSREFYGEGVTANDRIDDVCELMGAVQRHWCCAYCKKKETSPCNKKYPFSLAGKTKVRVVQKVITKKGGRKEITQRLELITRRNDKWANCYCAPLLQVHRANMDFRLTIDLGKVLEYMTKYATKPEPQSRSAHQMLSEAVREADPNEQHGRTLKRVMRKMQGQRVRSREETCHLMNSQSLVQCSHEVRVVYLNQDLDKVTFEANPNGVIELDENGQTRPQVRATAKNKTILQLYAQRTDPSLWVGCETRTKNKETNQVETTTHDDGGELYKEANQIKPLEDWSFDQFAQTYYSPASGVNANKIQTFSSRRSKKGVVIMFKPDLPSNSEFPCHTEYCRLSLVRCMPWLNDPDNTWRNYSHDDFEEDPSWSEEDKIRQVWYHYLETWDGHHPDSPMPDTFRQHMHRLRQEGVLRDAMDSSDLGGDTVQDDGEDGDPVQEANLDYMDVALDNEGEEGDVGEDEKIEPDAGVHFQERMQTYLGSEWDNVEEANPVDRLNEFIRDDPPSDRIRSENMFGNISFDCLNEGQQKIVKIVEAKLADMMHEDDPNWTPSPFSKLIILQGKGGTGKSHATNYLRSKYDPDASGIFRAFATLGRAASLIKGTTLYNRTDGLMIRVGTLLHELSDQSLRQLQERFRNTAIIVIDEYSMLHQYQLSWISYRLQQAKGNFKEPFGGLIVVLIGDTAQLPPVKGTALWGKSKSKDQHYAMGAKLFREEFQTAVELTENKRLRDLSHLPEDSPKRRDAERFQDVLLKVADGKLSIDDANWIIEKCSHQAMGVEEWRRRGFEEEGVIFIYGTNKQVDNQNHKILKQLRSNKGNKIAKLNAKHTGPSARGQSSDAFQGLGHELYISKDAQVMLTCNIWPQRGLANGSTGLVKDIVFLPKEDGSPPDLATELPAYIWVDFGEGYTGPSFFQSNYSERRGWVPIPTKTTRTSTPSRNPGGRTGEQRRAQGVQGVDAMDENTRTMVPLSLAWAWTCWKAQGQTMRGKVVVDLGTREPSAGYTYVAKSRVIDFDNLGIIGPISIQRLTSALNTKELKVRLKEDERRREIVEKTNRQFEEYFGSSEPST